LTLIQQDWFNLAAHKNSNPTLVEEHLNAFYSRFSNLLLERIVNMADANVTFFFFFYIYAAMENGTLSLKKPSKI
jgi:hypothetical protein